MKRLTKKQWFGPKYFGWGWRPVSWEGWISTIIFLAILLYVGRSNPENPNLPFYMVGMIVVFTIFCMLTGGQPGSVWLNTKPKK